MRPLEKDFGLLIARTHRVLRTYIYQILKSMHVTFEQFQVLVGLSAGDNIPQHVLAERMDLEPSSIARMLNRMEKRGLITRVEDEEDSRIRRVLMTEEGSNLWHRIAPVRDRYLEAALACLTDEEVSQLEQLLNRVREHVRELQETT